MNEFVHYPSVIYFTR